MSIHFLDKLNIPERFRVWYELPRIDIESEPLDTARWVVLPQRLLVYSQPELVKSLCDKHGADRLVLFDYSDQGHGDYPCTVFATNCRHDFPKKVIGYLTPITEKKEQGRTGVITEIPPKRIETRHTFSFVGDVSCHPIRREAAEHLKRLGGYVKMNDQAYVDDPNIGGVEYYESFNSFAMYAPPSRQPQTWRLLEAINAGVPVITTPIWQHNRLPESLTRLLLSEIGVIHDEKDIDGFKRAILTAIDMPELIEKRAKTLQTYYRQYVTHFWQFVETELSK